MSIGSDAVNLATEFKTDGEWAIEYSVTDRTIRRWNRLPEVLAHRSVMSSKESLGLAADDAERDAATGGAMRELLCVTPTGIRMSRAQLKMALYVLNHSAEDEPVESPASTPSASLSPRLRAFGLCLAGSQGTRLQLASEWGVSGRTIRNWSKREDVRVFVPRLLEERRSSLVESNKDLREVATARIGEILDLDLDKKTARLVLAAATGYLRTLPHWQLGLAHAAQRWQ